MQIHFFVAIPINKICPDACIEFYEDVFYFDKNQHKHAGKRRIVGQIIKESGWPGFYEIEVLDSTGPNSFGKGVIIHRPIGNLLSGNEMINSNKPTMRVMKSGGHVEGYKDGKKVVMDNASKGGIGIGASHAEGGIKGEVGTDKHKIEFEGSEIILTAPVSEDKTLYEFEGQQLTPRQIASKLNVDNGGVSFADGGEIHSCRCSGRSYQYGGKTMYDTDIVNEINRKSQLAKGFKIENREHRETLSKLNDGYITLDQAIAEIAETHLNENPNYYTNQTY